MTTSPHLLYLAHHPVEAADAVHPVHLGRYIDNAARLLSTVWHESVNPAMQPLAEVGRTKPRITHWVARAARPGQPRDAAPDKEYALDYGGMGMWLLDGKRIEMSLGHGHPFATWVGESAWQYEWAVEHSLQLLLRWKEHAAKHKKHRLDSVVHTLRKPPPDVTAHTMREPPIACPLDHCVVDNEGYVEAVPTYQAWYKAVTATLSST